MIEEIHGILNYSSNHFVFITKSTKTLKNEHHINLDRVLVLHNMD